METNTLKEILALPELPMGLGVGEEHTMLRDQARRMLAEKSSTEAVRAMYEEGADFDRGVWKEIAELGWLHCNVPESLGGSGMGALQLALVMEEMGRRLLAAPFLPSVMALALLSDSHSTKPTDAVQKWADGVMSGELLATVALSEPGGIVSPLETTCKASDANKVGGKFTLKGVKTHVLFGAQSELLLTSARKSDGSLGVFAVALSASGVTRTAEDTVDSTRPTARISLDAADATELPCDAALALPRMERLALVLLAAEMVGAAETLLGTTTEYAVDRKQFGKSIGAFQAVKHPLVDTLVGVEQARSLYVGGACALDHDPSRADVSCRMAKAMASDVLAEASKRGVQLHGGIGFTWECDVQLYFRRMLWARGTLGDSAYQRSRLGAALLAS
jgi:alkylation response protein AidB-like acyl-CoA dehydrogenase